MSKFGDQEAQFKRRARRRLIGAIVLVLVAVAVLPFVLDKEPEPIKETISIQIPPKDAEPAKPLAEQPAPPPVAAADPQAESKPALTEPSAESKAPSESPAPVEKEPAAGEPEAKPAEKREERKPTAGKPEEKGEFVVQLGSFSNPKNAKQAQERLKKAGIKSYTEVAQAGETKTTRVRAGPFSTREQAEKVREKVRALGFEGVVASR
jgi:DedD protein